MSEVKTRTCPKCGFNLVFEDITKPVYCECCEQTIAWDTDRTAAASSDDTVASTSMAMTVPAMMGFDNPESGIVFIENFFDNYNWTPYMLSPDIKIREIAKVVDNNKMTNGACAISWYLDYKALAYPLRKKIEGLAKHQQEMADLYNPVDPSDALALFDSYQRVCRALVNNKECVFKQLDNAIKYAEKFNLEAARMSEIKNDYTALKAAFEKEVVITKEISDIPAYAAARDAASKKIAEELAAKGIDAATTYQQAVNFYNDANPNKSTALALFEKVRGYGDSVLYIKKINQYFNFDDTMYRAFGKYYIYKAEDYTPTLDLKNLGEIAKKVKKAKKEAAPAPESTEPTAVKALSLYEVVDGKPAKESSIKGIDQIIGCYGGRLYYFKSNDGIYCYDVFTHTEAAICKGKNSDFKNESNEYEYGKSSDGSSFYVKKKVTKEILPEAKGCAVMKKFKKDAAPVSTFDPLNPYCVVSIDMKTNTCTTIVQKLAAVAERHNDKLFYTLLEKPEPAKSGCLNKLTGKTPKEPEVKTRLMVCDVAKGMNKQVLDDDCEIHTVYNDYIVYSLWMPNELNKDLHVLNIYTGKDIIVEQNIFNYFAIYGGKVYYTVGNKDYCPLVSNNFEGTDRREIMPRVANIIGERGGWLYVKKGYKKNAALFKVSLDGTEIVPLCSQFSHIAREIEDNYIYYVDVFNSLRVMRIDGKENRKLADNVTKVFPSDEGLYYVRNEYVEANTKALSLYLMDKGGRNVKKIKFNVDVVQNDPTTDTIYYSKEENLRFRVYLPGKEAEAVYEFHKINRFYVMDKNTGESKLVLTIGWPEGSTETGCLFRKKKVEYIYEVAPVILSYKRKGLSTEEEEETTADVPAATTTNNSLTSMLPAGCASILNKVNPNNGGKQSAVQTKLRAAKAKASAKVTQAKSKAKSSASGAKAKASTLILLYVALGLGVWAIMTFSKALEARHFYGVPASKCIVPFIMMLLTGGFAAVCAGLIPVGNMKRSKPLAIVYVTVAILFAVSGIMYVANSSSQSSSMADDSKSTITLYEGETERIKIGKYESVGVTFKPTESGFYAIEAYDLEGNLNISGNYGTQTIENNGKNQKAYFELDSYTSYTFWISYEDYAKADKVDICIMRTAEGQGPNIPFQISANDNVNYANGSISGSSDYSAVWYEFKPYRSGRYTVTITAQDSIKVTGYKRDTNYGNTTDSYDTEMSNVEITWDFKLNNSNSSYIFKFENIYSTYTEFAIKIQYNGYN